MSSDWDEHVRAQVAAFGGAVEPLRALLDDVIDQGWEAGQQRGWVPRRGSQGDLDHRDLRWGKRTNADLPSPVEFGHATANVLLMATHDHLHALGRLLGPPPAVYATVAVARAAIEAAARLAWLADLDCDKRTRVARYLTQHMLELRWRAALPSPGARGDAEQALERLAGQAADAGFDTRRDSRGRLSKVEVEPPKLEWLVGDLARDGGREPLVTLYRVYSHTVHGGAFALTRSMRVDPDAGDPGVGVVSRVVDPREASQMAGAVALAALHGTDKLARLFGWDHSHWSRWVRGAVARASRFVTA